MTEVYANMEVSHGTMLNADLLDSFGSLLLRIDNVSHAHRLLAHEAASLIELGNEETEAGSEVVHELFDALESYAPEGCYFGAHEGDGSAYGFWEFDPDIDGLYEERRAMGLTALD